MDDKELEAIVQSLLEAGESEETVAAVIKQYLTDTKANTPISEPTSWGEGVLNSITSGDAPYHGLRGAGGFLKGAIADLPGSIMSGLGSVAKIASHPKEGEKELERIWAGLKEAPGQMWDAAKQSGSSPQAAEDFGRMMGQTTGQPALTAGAAKYSPSAISASKMPVGRGLETVGNAISKHGVLSGLMPPITVPRYLRLGERAGGRGLEWIGQRMQGKNKGEYKIRDEGKGSDYRVRSEEPDFPSEPIAGELVDSSRPGNLNVDTKQLYPSGLPPKSPRKITLKRKSTNDAIVEKLRARGYKFESSDGDNVVFRLEQ